MNRDHGMHAEKTQMTGWLEVDAAERVRDEEDRMTRPD